MFARDVDLEPAHPRFESSKVVGRANPVLIISWTNICRPRSDDCLALSFRSIYLQKAVLPSVSLADVEYLLMRVDKRRVSVTRSDRLANMPTNPQVFGIENSPDSAHPHPRSSRGASDRRN
jgi:hypothetical protein